MQANTQEVKVSHTFNGTAISANTAFQFFVGLGTLLVGWQLWRSGWFSATLFNSLDKTPPSSLSYGGTGSLFGLLIDTVCSLGIGVISLFGLMKRGLGYGNELVSGLIRGPGGPVTAANAIPAPGTPTIDPKALQRILGRFQARLEALEGKGVVPAPATAPEPEPVQEPPQAPMSVDERMLLMMDSMKSMEARIAGLSAAKAPRKTSTPRTRRS